MEEPWWTPWNKRRQERRNSPCALGERHLALLAGRTLPMRRKSVKSSSATKFFRHPLPLDSFHVLHLAAVAHLPTAKWLTLYLLVNQNQNSLTLLQRGCLPGWRECCPCQSGTWSYRRRNAGSAGRRGLVSPGWYPGGPGSPGTARWRGTVAASSSLGPCNPPGHLRKGKEDFRAMVTRGVADFGGTELFPVRTTEKREFTPA